MTINLPYIALLSEGNEDKFWKILDEYLELCHGALQIKHKRLLGTKAKVAPILWMHGALARLDADDVIDPLLYNGYSTISLGYAGICEMTYVMKGMPHTEPEGKEFALRVMQRLNDKCAEWKAAENIDYSVYGTPIESTTEKFARALQKKFGVIEHVSDRNYVTNSFHVHVTQPISPFDKLAIESEFEALSPGGVVEYIEAGGPMSHNIDAIMSVIRFIYDHNQYGEINLKLDYCNNCGYDGEIKIVTDEHGKHKWRCPQCGNEDQTKMNITRRTCGYLGTNYWSQGRTEEIKERYEHL